MRDFLADLGPTGLAILSSVVGGLAGAIASAILTGIFVEKHWASRQGESTLIDSLVNDVGALEEKTINYWSLDCRGDAKKNEEDREKSRALAAKIKMDILKLHSSLRQYSERYRRNIDFGQLIGEVQDACTNGQFDSPRRAPDHDRYKLVVNATNRVRSSLFACRV